jgi:CRP/FNR family transcriptional regulator, cyclic AMP receptor protein
MSQNFQNHTLHRIGWLAGAPSRFREAVLARCDRISLKAGQSVYHFGDNVGGIVGVSEGFMQVHGRAHGEEPTLVHIAGPGFWTGEFATATGQARIVSLVAHTDLVLLRLPRAEFQRIAAADPQAWHQLAVLSTRNTALALDMIAMLRRGDPVERLAHALHLLFREVPQPQSNLRVSQADLGAVARMSRTSVNAALQVLEARGLVRPVYRGIEILAPEALQALVAGD